MFMIYKSIHRPADLSNMSKFPMDFRCTLRQLNMADWKFLELNRHWNGKNHEKPSNSNGVWIRNSATPKSPWNSKFNSKHVGGKPLSHIFGQSQIKWLDTYGILWIDVPSMWHHHCGWRSTPGTGSPNWKSGPGGAEQHEVPMIIWKGLSQALINLQVNELTWSF